jgi:hypothetical protein
MPCLNLRYSHQHPPQRAMHSRIRDVSVYCCNRCKWLWFRPGTIPQAYERSALMVMPERFSWHRYVGLTTGWQGIHGPHPRNRDLCMRSRIFRSSRRIPGNVHSAFQSTSFTASILPRNPRRSRNILSISLLLLAPFGTRATEKNYC